MNLPVYRLAKEYGQSPKAIGEWDVEEFDEAWDMYVAENREKWPLDDVSISVAPKANDQTLLDHDQRFWMRFVVSGKLDQERLTEAGYSPAQIPYITSEMNRLGWMPS